MHCYICDRLMSDTEIEYVKETKSFECCSTCLEIALDAAYSNGFKADGEEEDNDLGILEQSLEDITLDLNSFTEYQHIQLKENEND